MPKREPILTAQNKQQDLFKFTAAKDAANNVTVSNRSIPYLALALGLYENQPNPIQFAINNLDLISNFKQPSETITNISKVYSVLEIYADRLGAQRVITLPQLAELYGNEENLTGWELAVKNGYDRIWDCGTLKFELSNI